MLGCRRKNYSPEMQKRTHRTTYKQNNLRSKKPEIKNLEIHS